MYVRVIGIATRSAFGLFPTGYLLAPLWAASRPGEGSKGLGVSVMV